jgi:dTDP-D-glucose 4,6-dehydratase
MPRKLLDVSRLHTLGWRHRIALADGIRSTYEWFLANQTSIRTSSPAAVAGARVHAAPWETSRARAGR